MSERLSAGTIGLVAALLMVASAGVHVARGAGYLGGLRTAPPVVVSAAPVQVVSDTLRPRETVSDLFQRRGVSDVDWNAVARAVRAFEPARLRAGLVFNFRRRHGESEPNLVTVRFAYDTRLELARAQGHWTASVEHIPWHAETFVIQGTVSSSVSDAITGAIGDEVLPRESRVQLVWSLADVYDWEVDFSRDVQPGDRFRVLAERLVAPDGEVRYGRILAARLDVGPKPLYAFRFDDDSGRQEFYDERARSLRRELLRAPLEFKRIGSGFSRSRYHPILHYRRPHLGIDFGAAYGAPVRSVGNGTVTIAGRMGGYGNMVEIRHNGTISSRYAHLSGFAPEVHVGAQIQQGETIGYVGASGLATSPHLHYELRINGRAVNPRRQFGVGDGQPIAASRRAAFEEEKRRLRELFEPATVASSAASRTD